MATPAGNSKVFISYRRADVGGHAGRLFDRLRHWFDAGVLFYDLDGIDSGDSFPEVIQSALDSAAVVLVVIGPDWLAEINRRVAQPGVDFVRREVEQALARRAANCLVVPVLMGAAAKPAAHQFHADLQASLAPLCALEDHPFQGKQVDWDARFACVRQRIAGVPGVPKPRFRAPAGSEQPFRVIEQSLSPHFQDPNGLLARLHGQLHATGSAAVLARAALYGMGGVGKTQLALKYSLEYRDAYAGVWWFAAETETGLQRDAQTACEAATVPVAEGELPAAALKRWLERQETSWLLVFDNAVDEASLRLWLPERGRHHIIITSRNPAWSGLASAVELEVWTPEQGADFLAGRLPGAARGELLALARELGGLPLALEQAASYLEATGTSVADYRKLLSAVDTEGLILDEGRAATGYERSVAATLPLSFSKLSPAAQQLLRLCSFAAPEPLPERFFREAAAELPPELAEAAGNPLIWNRVAGELLRYGLAQRLPIPALDRDPGEITERTEQSLSLHRLTQQTVRARLAEPETDCRSFQAVLRTCCPADAELPVHWPRYAALAPHVTQLDRYYAYGWLDARCLCRLLDVVGTYFRYGPTLYGDSVYWLRRALEIDKLEQGEEHPIILVRTNNFANALSDQGEMQAASDLLKETLTVRLRKHGRKNSDTLINMGNLADARRKLGDLAGARTLEEQVVAVRREVFGEEDTNTLISMGNLARTLKAQGDLPSARALQEQVLNVFRRKLPQHLAYTLTSMINLGLTLYDLSDLTAAKALQEEVLKISGEEMGKEHRDTLHSMHNLACTLWQMGERLSALELMLAATEGLRKRFGPDNPDTLGSQQEAEYMQSALSPPESGHSTAG
jgi:tetratricopeptide (TPR) repeat protein